MKRRRFAPEKVKSKGAVFLLAFTFSLFTFSPFHPVFSQGWQTARAPGLVVRTASPQDARYLPRVFAALRKARLDLTAQGYRPPQTVAVVVHPNLDSYLRATGARWFVAAVANREQSRIDTQRLRILSERGSLERTLRHELFHLAQPADWPRWKAEGMAMRFSGDAPGGEPLAGVSEAELNRLLADPPDPATLARAMATAHAWAGGGR